MSRLRVGLVGLGAVALGHLEAYRSVESITLVSGADPLESTRDQVARPYGLNYYSDFRQMLESETLDLVCVLTPPTIREEVVLQCAQRGIHILCEKPLALDCGAARRMIEACEQAGVKFFYGACYRFLPAIRGAYDLIRSGAIGGVTLLRESVIGGSGAQDRRPLGFSHYPLGGPGGSGMGLVDHGIHLIDVFEWLCGSKAIAILGQGNISGADAKTEYLIMKFAGGSLGHLLYSDATFSTDLPNEGIFSAGSSWDFSGAVPAGGWSNSPGCIHVHGTTGALRIFHYANTLFHISRDGIRQIPVHGAASPFHFAALMRDCVERIAAGRAPEIDGTAGLRALEILLAGYLSAETNAFVPV